MQGQGDAQDNAVDETVTTTVVVPAGQQQPTVMGSSSTAPRNGEDATAAVTPFVRTYLNNPDRSTMESLWRLRSLEENAKARHAAQREAEAPALRLSSTTSTALTVPTTAVQLRAQRAAEDQQLAIHYRQQGGALQAVNHHEAHEYLATQGLNSVLTQLPSATPLSPRTAQVAKCMFGSTQNSPLTLSKIAATMIASDPTMQQKIRDDAWRVAMSLAGEQPTPPFPNDVVVAKRPPPALPTTTNAVVIGSSSSGSNALAYQEVPRIEGPPPPTGGATTPQTAEDDEDEVEELVRISSHTHDEQYHSLDPDELD